MPGTIIGISMVWPDPKVPADKAPAGAIAMRQDGPRAARYLYVRSESGDWGRARTEHVPAELRGMGYAQWDDARRCWVVA